MRKLRGFIAAGIAAMTVLSSTAWGFAEPEGIIADTKAEALMSYITGYPGYSDALRFLDEIFEDYLTKGYKLVFYDNLTTDKLTTELLTTRTQRNELTVEVFYGGVLNYEGDGMVFFCADEESNYISYREAFKDIGLELTPGSIVCTYAVYNPLNNGEDDIVERYDYLIYLAPEEDF